MTSTIFPILVAVTVAMIGWGVSSVIMTMMRNEKRRLHQRLSGEGRAPAEETAKSIVLARGEARRLAEGGKGFLARVIRNLAIVKPDVAPSRFFLMCAVIASVLFCATAAVSMSIVAGLGAALVGAYIPMMIINGRAASRQRVCAWQLPEAMDFLGRILRAGHSLSTGIQMLGSEIPQPLAGEFQKCYDQHSLGQPLEDCLKDMAKRVQSTDFAFFVTAVLIQRQTGGDLSVVLGNISNMIRGRVRLQSYVKAKTAEGRFSGNLLVAFPAVMFGLSYMLNPVYAGMLIHTDTGLELLGTAVALQILGLIVIRKITTVRV